MNVDVQKSLSWWAVAAFSEARWYSDIPLYGCSSREEATTPLTIAGIGDSVWVSHLVAFYGYAYLSRGCKILQEEVPGKLLYAARFSLQLCLFSTISGDGRGCF